MINMIKNYIKNCEKVIDFLHLYITGSAKQIAMHGHSNAVSFAVLLSNAMVYSFIGITSITVYVYMTITMWLDYCNSVLAALLI